MVSLDFNGSSLSENWRRTGTFLSNLFGPFQNVSSRWRLETNQEVCPSLAKTSLGQNVKVIATFLPADILAIVFHTLSGGCKSRQYILLRPIFSFRLGRWLQKWGLSDKCVSQLKSYIFTCLCVVFLISQIWSTVYGNAESDIWHQAIQSIQ